MDAHVRDLRAFLAVSDELHFTRAAETLFISQPALSKQVRALEQLLRAPLFVRERTGVHLTAAGEALLPHARQVVTAWDRAQQAVGESVATTSSTLTVTLTISLGRGLLPAVRDLFTRREPAWRLEVRQVGFDDPTHDVRTGSADAAFAWLPVPDAQLRHAVLYREERLVALPAGHRLAQRAQVPFIELLDEPFLALPASAGALRAHWLAEDARGGRPVRVGAVVHGPEDTVEALAQGLGVALITAGNAERYQRPEFVSRPVPGLSPGELAVVWRRDDHRPALSHFVRSCLQAARSVQAPATAGRTP